MEFLLFSNKLQIIWGFHMNKRCRFLKVQHFLKTTIKPRSWTLLIFRQLLSDSASVLHWTSKVRLFVAHKRNVILGIIKGSL